MAEPVYAAIALAIAGAERGAPTEILLLPAGELTTRPSDSRASWFNTNPAGVAAASRKLGQDLVIDFDHQTQRSATNGLPAPAAGWIKRVFERDGAVWGAVEWTAEAARMIAAKQYRFISPVFHFERATRRVLRIHGAALTNEPALYMPALARTNHGGNNMDILKKLRAALNLADDATEDDIVAAVERLAGESAETRALAAVDRHTAQGRISTAMREPMLALARRDLPGFEAFAASMPMMPDTTEARATTAVDRHIAQGRIPPACREHALALARQDAAGFESFAGTLPAFAAGATIAGLPPGPADGALTDTERAAARALGLTTEQYQQSRQALAQARAEGDL